MNIFKTEHQFHIGDIVYTIYNDNIVECVISHLEIRAAARASDSANAPVSFLNLAMFTSIEEPPSPDVFKNERVMEISIGYGLSLIRLNEKGDYYEYCSILQDENKVFRTKLELVDGLLKKSNTTK